MQQNKPLSLMDELNIGAQIGVAFCKDGSSSRQVENILIALESVEGRESLLIVAAFAHRQAQRTKTLGFSAKLIGDAMLKIYNSGGGKEDARIVLGVAKWVFEALGGKDESKGGKNTKTCEKAGKLLEQLQKGPGITLEEVIRHLSSLNSQQQTQLRGPSS
uniref:Uncharacterized protein n=1 Tax=Thermosphaera aggregans TaxID=54254 RepID=A0A7C2FYR0_9CREN